MELLYVV